MVLIFICKDKFVNYLNQNRSLYLPIRAMISDTIDKIFEEILVYIKIFNEHCT